jgi:taurine dioxygenase
MVDLRELSMGTRDFLRDERERLAALRYEHFRIAPISPTIGGEVSGVDLGAPLADTVIKEIRSALVDFKVLFFRDQKIDVEQQAAFASRFGELETHPFLPSNTKHAQVIHFAKDEKVRGYENIWHSDVSWREKPSFGSILHALEVPAIGGDTLWCDMEAAYTGLPDDVKERIADLRAVHDFSQSFGALLPPDELAERQKQFPSTAHPVVRTNPDSGRKCIYVNSIFTHHIEGVSEQESDDLLTFLYAQAKVPEYQCRFKWSPGAVAFWDNRSTQHYAVSDYWPERRTMERVTVIGDRPH